jgi:ATP-dependent helicase HrpA
MSRPSASNDRRRHWQDTLERVMLSDRWPLARRIARWVARPSEPEAQQIDAAIGRSLARAGQRRESLPVPRFPEELPVSALREEIAATIAAHQVVIVSGETGSGKTTQLPKICLMLGRGVRGLIGHTQPRRIAARTVATRIAHELGTKLGDIVGYQVRFTGEISERNLIKLMTDGILLAETQTDRFLNAYDTLIIDEAHERSLNIDFLLGYLKQLLP